MLLRLLAVSLLVLTTVAAGAADKPSGVTGLFLTTRYPALTVRAGETTTIDLSLRNFNLPPQAAGAVGAAASERVESYGSRRRSADRVGDCRTG